MPRRRLFFVLGLTLVGLLLATAWAQSNPTPSSTPNDATSASASHASSSSSASPSTITVQPGDTLWGLAQRYGTTVADLRQANGLVGSALQPGTTLDLPQGGNATPDAYVVQPGDTLYNIALAFHLSVDDLIAYNHLDGSVIKPGQTLKLRPTSPAPAPLVITVQPGDTLWNLAQSYHVSVGALTAANHLASAAVIHPGDSLTVPGRYAGPTTDTGGPVPPTVTVTKGDSLWSIAHRFNTSVAALMSANDLSNSEVFAGQTLRIVPSGELGPARSSTATPTPTPSNGMMWPIHGPITSHFGYRQLRVDGSNFHTGIDIAANTGQPIRAAVSGTVALAGWNGGYGLCVIIKNGNTSYYYGHASALLVKRGEYVQEGQIIARIGDTGHSTGPHLHFEIRVDNEPVDPLPLLQTRASR